MIYYDIYLYNIDDLREDIFIEGIENNDIGVDIDSKLKASIIDGYCCLSAKQMSKYDYYIDAKVNELFKDAEIIHKITKNDVCFLFTKQHTNVIKYLAKGIVYIDSDKCMLIGEDRGRRYYWNIDRYVVSDLGKMLKRCLKMRNVS